MHSFRRRLPALALLLVGLFGGVILPGADAVMFHGRGAATALEVRLEATSSGGHAVQCPQADQLRGGRVLVASSPQTHAEMPVGVAIIARNNPHLLSAPVHTSVLPRAPPSYLA
ncbi:MAG TPA: hypothetical protein VH438_09160 [Gemmatimonadales bacterium]